MPKRNDRLKQWSHQWLSRSDIRLSARLSGKTRAKLNMLERDHLTVNSHLEELASVQQWFRALIVRLAVKTPWVGDQFDQLNLALAEGFTNAVRHAHADLPTATPIEIELVLQPKQIEICIFDQGAPFDPNSLVEPQPGTLREGGYGWFLLRRLADKVTYDRTSACTEAASDETLPGKVASTADGVSTEGPRNCLRIIKKLSPAQ